MARDKSEVAERAEEVESESAAGEVVLRDESDEIIDNLKQKLESLQNQLAAYKDGGEIQGGGAAGGTPPAAGLLPGTFEGALAPHLASRLQVPAEELTARLDRLIEKVDDPELRQELEHCRNTAFFLFETFQKISANHRQLTESLVSPKSEVESAQFCRLMERSLPALGSPISVRKGADLPQRIVLASKSAAVVVKTLTELAHAFTGKLPQIEVSKGAPREGESSPMLKIGIFSDIPWSDAEEAQEVTAFAMKKGITAGTIVDLLYVEKVIEMQGGTFSFHRVEGKVHGFSVQLPYDEADDN